MSRVGKMVTQYFDMLSEYQKIYGVKTTILYQKGTFYELYGIDNNNEKINDINHIFHDILNMDVSYVSGFNTDSNTRQNPQMAGFPVHTLEKNLPLLLLNGYTVVEVIEDGDIVENGKKIKNRRVKCVHSLTTTQIMDSRCDGTCLICVYIEQVKKSYLPIISSLDLRTGHSNIYHFYDVSPDEIIGSCISVLNSINFRESILVYNNCDPNEIIKLLNLNANNVFLRHDKEVSKISYQNEFLSQIYTKTKKQTPLGFLGLSMYQEAGTCFTHMLRYAYEHDHDIVGNLKKPEVINITKFLSLSENGIKHLNLLDNNDLFLNKDDKVNSLLSVIDHTTTPMGRRLLRYKITHPIFHVKRLNLLYNSIDDLWEADINLKSIGDLEKMHRCMALGKFTPMQLLQLDKYLNNVLIILENIQKYKYVYKYLNKLSNIEDCIEKIKNFILEYKKIINVDKLASLPLTKKFESMDQVLNENIDVNIDKYRKIVKKLNTKINVIWTRVEALCSGSIKPVFLDRIGLVIRVAKKKAEMLMKELSADYNMKSESRVKAGMDLTCEVLQKWSLKRNNTTDKIIALNNTIYMDHLCKWYTSYGDTILTVCKLMAELDIINSFAYTSKLYKYNRPTIIGEENSFISANKLRNPIIERLSNSSQYVPIDIELRDKKTILLYGINSSGKSTILRTLGLNVVLAQIGCYVPAEKFEYFPFTRIFTKMNNDDNLFLGQSTYVLEMLQLKSMLQYSNTRSLILGDEIASGTETHSAVSILSSALIQLCNKGICTVFTTHYHEIMDIQEVISLKTLDIRHIEIRVVNGELVYNRELKPGSGRSDYGIKIASLLNMDEEFINTSKKIKNLICDDKLVGNKSKYNTDVYMTKCTICDSRKNLDTHHINFQSHCDENDMTSTGMHKNSKNNLVVLCKKCHKKLHKDIIQIDGFIDTENGVKLLYTTQSGNKKLVKK